MGWSVSETVGRLTSSVSESQLDRAARVSKDRRRPLSLGPGLFAFFLSSLWGGQPIALKAGLADAPPFRIGWMRFALGLVVFIVWAFASKQSFRFYRSETIPLLLLGILFSVQIASMNLGQDLTTAGHAGVVITTFPLWASVFAHLFVPGDKLSTHRVLGAGIAYSGVVIVFARGFFGEFESPNASNPWLGDLLLMFSAMLLGLRQVYISQLGQNINQVKILMTQGIFGVVSFLIASTLIEPEPMQMTLVLAISLLYQGVVIAGFGFIGQTWLLSNYLPSRVSIISLSQPIMATFLAWAILKESIGPELYAGAALVIIGSYLTQRR